MVIVIPASPCRSQLSEMFFTRSWVLPLCGLFFLAGAGRAQQDLIGTAPAFNIQPMTQVDVNEHLGYFGDPYPIHSAPGHNSREAHYFSGTTPELLQCKGTVRAECFSADSLKLTMSDSLHADVQAAGNQFGAVINHNVYQTDDGTWQMAVTLYVHPKENSNKRWTVIAHAHAKDPTALEPPVAWVADKILVGSLSTFDYANYDGKGIVAQAMRSPSEPGSEAPVLLLAPNSGDESLNSEYFHTTPPTGDTFKLIETGNVIKIADKYVMAYSVGDYQQLDYKTGVAYSDTLLPKKGEGYRKIVVEDSAGVWGQAGHAEVRYLLQSQKQDWPNYIASQVIAPGVPSIVQEKDGRFLLFFDGFLPGDTPQAPNTPNNPLNIEPDHRRPFFVPLEVRVPANLSVGKATDAELSSWIMPR